MRDTQLCTIEGESKPERHRAVLPNARRAFFKSSLRVSADTCCGCGGGSLCDLANDKKQKKNAQTSQHAHIQRGEVILDCVTWMKMLGQLGGKNPAEAICRSCCLVYLLVSRGIFFERIITRKGGSASDFHWRATFFQGNEAAPEIFEAGNKFGNELVHLMLQRTPGMSYLAAACSAKPRNVSVCPPGIWFPRVSESRCFR